MDGQRPLRECGLRCFREVGAAFPTNLGKPGNSKPKFPRENRAAAARANQQQVRSSKVKNAGKDQGADHPVEEAKIQTEASRDDRETPDYREATNHAAEYKPLSSTVRTLRGTLGHTREILDRTIAFQPVR